jgi:hypothetical protein
VTQAALGLGAAVCAEARDSERERGEGGEESAMSERFLLRNSELSLRSSVYEL